MTHAVLLSAGQGRRLSPLTDEKPKCLVTVAGKTILEWQLHAIAACGIDSISIVTGFEAQSVEASVKVMSLPVVPRCIFNPFFGVADNIGSCWAARDLIGSDTVLINGDTLFDKRILESVLNGATDPITVTVDNKPSYDSDDMKVQISKGRLKRIGKNLTGKIDGESIGMLRFLGDGGDMFTNAMKQMLHNQDALRLWYLSIIDKLAPTGSVGALSIEGLPWAEVDFPHDLPFAADQVGTFNWEQSRTSSMEPIDATTMATGERRP